jgi:hypothetical protein
MISHLLPGRNARSRRSGALRLAAFWPIALFALGSGPAPCGGAPDVAGETDAVREAGDPPSSRSAAAGPAADASSTAGPCDSTDLELSAPLGTVLRSSRLMLRWRSNEAGPFQVSVLDEKGRTVYAADTYGHELRVLMGGDGAVTPGRDEEQIRNGRSYRWRVIPKFAPDPTACPTAEFRLLAEDESREKTERFEAEAESLGVGDDSREPEASIALANEYLREGFYSEAEALLLKLRERAYEDERIESLLSDLYRRTGRPLSLAALETPPEEPRAF